MAAKLMSYTTFIWYGPHAAIKIYILPLLTALQSRRKHYRNKMLCMMIEAKWTLMISHV